MLFYAHYQLIREQNARLHEDYLDNIFKNLKLDDKT